MQNGYAWVNCTPKQNLTREYTFEQANGVREFLANASKQAGAVLQTFPRNTMGLVSDEVRNSTSYQNALRDFALIFAQQRKFNMFFCKKFKKEYAAWRNAQREATLV